MPTILVTGATDGIGRQTALELARKGAHVLVHGRTEKKARAAVDALHKAGSVEPVFGDLSSLAEVRALARAIHDVDVVVHNAGVFLNQRETSADGFELTFAVNHLAPFVLTHELLPLLRQKPEARVVVVASMAHSGGRLDFADLQMERDYDGYRAYATSKLMNVMFAYDLARRLRDTKIAVNALHPGVISTKLLRTGFGGMGGASLEQGARTSVRVATDPALAGVTGKYFSDAREAASSRASHDERVQRELYRVSCDLASVTPLP
jgi:NAD(P)-dependent dehydrogenase (short-subunit alcohol dehydrogenase family)